MPDPILVIDGLSKQFSGVRAVDALDLSLPGGQVTALIGPNGAGKSTAINVISGMFRASAGRVVLHDRDISKLSMPRRARLGIGRTFQHPHMIAGARVGDMLDLAADAPRARARARRSVLAQAASSFSLDGRLEEPVESLPYGHQKLLNLAMVWVAQPDVILLDEPFAGVGPEHREPVIAALQVMVDSGAAVVLVEHDLELVTELAQVAVVMDAGRKIFAGPVQNALRDPAVISAYLGSKQSALVVESAAGYGEPGERGESLRVERPRADLD